MIDNEKSLKVMSSGDIIDYSIEAYKKNFKKLSILTLALYVPFSVIYVIILSYFSSEFEKVTINNNGSFIDFFSYMIVVLVAMLFYLVYMLTINTVLESAISKIIYNDFVFGKSLEIKQTLKESFKKLPSLVGYKLLFYLIMSGTSFAAFFGIYLFSIIFVLLGVSTFMVSGSIGEEAGGIVLIIGSILIIVGFVFGVLLLVGLCFIKLGFGVQAISIDKANVSQAFSKNVGLSKKMYWRSFWAMFFGLIIYMFLPVISTGLLQVVSFVDKELFNQINVISSSFIQIAQAFMYPFFVTLMTVTYINFKVKNEALDLELKVDKLIEAQKEEGC